MTTADIPGGPTGTGAGTGTGTSSTGAAAQTGSTGSESGKEQAKQAAGVAADQGKQVAGTAQDEARRVASEARSQARGLLDQATSQVEDQSRTQRDRLVDVLRSVGDDLDTMASHSDGGTASDLVHEVADRAKALSSRLDGREPRELLEDVRGFARRRPGTFLLGALVAGVVAGRLTRGARDASSGNGGGLTGTGTRTGTTIGSGESSMPAVSFPEQTSVGTRPTPTRTHGTATGDPLAGTGIPPTEPVYPGGAEVSDGAGVRGDLP
jgi:F0F1-type ATP synthase membrane subunit b/b'